MKLLCLAAAVLLGISTLPCEAQKPKKDREEREPEPVFTNLALKRLKATVTTPLFVQQTPGVNSMGNITMTATAVPMRFSGPVEVTFKPPLGPAGEAALAAVKKYLRTLHRGWPVGHHVEITFTYPVAPDDIAAAALGAAVLIDSMIGGWEADPSCAVLGALQADGKVLGVSSALGRLTTSVRAGVSRILVPEKNVTQASDCMVNEGVAAFGRVQMLSVKDFEEVPQMAAIKLEPNIAEAIKTFAETQKTFLAAGAGAAEKLKNGDVQEELREVLQNWPNHVTARLLLGHSVGRYKTFSIQGSVEAIDKIAATLLIGIQSARPYEVKALPLVKIDEELARLRLAAARLDPQAKTYVEQVIRYGEAARVWHVNPPKTTEDFNDLTETLKTAATIARDERQKLAAALAKPIVH